MCGEGLAVVYIVLQWAHSAEVIWLSTCDAYDYLGDWYVGLLIDFVNSSYAIDDEGHEDLVYHALDQSGL